MIYATVADVADYLRADSAISGMWPTIDTAAGFASLTNLPLEPWSIYVIPLSERPIKNGFLGAHIQIGDESIGILYCVQAANDAAGRDAMREASPRIAAVRSLIAGWSPDTSREAFDFTAGNHIDYRPGLLIWRDDFTTRNNPITDAQ